MSEQQGNSGPTTSRDADPEEVIDGTAVDANTPSPKVPARAKAAAVDRPYPRRTLEDAMKVPTAIKSGNNGNPWSPDQVAKALGMGTGSSFFYLAQAARDFGLTEGGRDAAQIALTERGRKAVFPNKPEDVDEAKMTAFLSVDKFAGVARHYGGSNLPGDEFVKNTLQTQFNLDPRVHDEFLDLFKKNCRYVGIGSEWDGASAKKSIGSGSSAAATISGEVATTGVAGGTHYAVASSDEKRPVCFVAMPFSEKTDDFATGFFAEVYASLFVPAIEAAGMMPQTARRQGSDVIQATIINDLLDADLVLVDLTEHNPNVLFELGIRISQQKPTVLVKATGTNPIFDVDHLLRVESYNPNVWPSTVKDDLPKLTAHIKGAWASRETQATYMSILRAGAASVS